MNIVNQVSTSDLQQLLHQLEFVPLLTGADGTKLALRNYDTHGVNCRDFLVFREINGKSEALRDEATLLFQNITHLQTLLLHTPHHLSSDLQCHAITFLGKKAYLLIHESGKLVTCRFFPLLIQFASNNRLSGNELGSVYPSHIVQATGVESYLKKNYPKSIHNSSTSETVVQPIRQSYRHLGLALMLFPIFLGLAGVFWALDLPLITLLLLFTGIVGPLLLLKKAKDSFKQFHLQTTITVPVPDPLPTVINGDEFSLNESPLGPVQENITEPENEE